MKRLEKFNNTLICLVTVPAFCGETGIEAELLTWNSVILQQTNKQNIKNAMYKH